MPQQLVDAVHGMTYHAFTATMQAPHEYLEQQALPDRLTTLDPPRTAVPLLAFTAVHAAQTD